MSFTTDLAERNADTYVDFLIPHLSADQRLLDIGCGSGTISLGVAGRVGRVTAVDLDDDQFADARGFAARSGMENIEFRAGTVYSLEFPDDHFDACLCHSMLETLENPLEALIELRRTLKPGGVLGAACVEYGGLILAGPNEPLLRRFYDIRERLWRLENVADPYQNRELRGLLQSAGFERVTATSTYISYGTPDAVSSFGNNRAEDCRDEWYAGAAKDHGLATSSELDAMEEAWVGWSTSPAAYVAFAWCRAIGWKPDG